MAGRTGAIPARPLWLCDVALLAETLPGNSDWDYVLGLPARQIEEPRVAVRLAHEVLGAGIDDTPWSGTNDRLPAWLPAATMAVWSRSHYSTTPALALTETQVSAIVESLRLRRPNPIEVTSRWGGSYDGMLRLPLQLWDVAVRTARGILDAPSKLARRRCWELLGPRLDRGTIRESSPGSSGCWSAACQAYRDLGRALAAIIVHQDQDPVLTSDAWLQALILDPGVRVSYSERGAKDNPWIGSLWSRVKGGECVILHRGPGAEGPHRAHRHAGAAFQSPAAHSRLGNQPPLRT